MGTRPRLPALAAIYRLLLGLLGWGALGVLWLRAPQPLPLVALTLFALLSTGIKRLGFRVARNVTHSLVGIVDLAALFSFGVVGGGLVAAASGAVCQAICRERYSHRPWHEVALGALFGGGLNALMALAAGEAYAALGGAVPMSEVSWSLIPAALAACVTWFVLDHAGWALVELLIHGREGVVAFLHEILPYSVLVELAPLPSSVLITAAFLSGSEPLLALTVLALLGIGLVLRQLMVSLSEERRHVHQLSAISSLGQALLSARLDLKEICLLVQRHCTQIVEAPAFILQLQGEQPTTIEAPVLALEGRLGDTRARELGVGGFRWIQLTYQPILIADFAAVEAPFAPLETGQPVRSGLYVPVIVENRMVGAISMQSPLPEAFTLEDQQALVLVASQVAMSLHTAQLYRREQQRAAQLEAIAQVSRKVAAILDLETLFADTVKLIKDTFGYYHVSILSVDAEHQEVTLQASSSPLIQERGLIVPWGKGIIGHTALTGRTTLANDVLHDPHFLPDSALEETRAELAVPLKVEQRIVGVLDMQSNRAGSLGESDVFVLQTLADQVAIAIEDSRLYQAQQEQAWVSTALLQVAEAVAQLSTAEEILASVMRLVPMLTGVDRSLVFLWSEEKRSFSAVGSVGLSPEQEGALRGQSFASGAVPLLGRVLAEGQMVAGRSEDLLAFLPPPLSADPRRGDLLAVPLRTKGEIIGVLVAEELGGETRPLASRRAILTGIAHHAAMALETARLYASQREEAWVSTALLQVANMISATVDLDTSISTVVRAAPLLVGVSWCGVFLWDEAQGAFLSSHSYGLRGKASDLFDGQRASPEGTPLLERVTASSQPLTVSRGEAARLLPPGWAEALEFDALSALPLRVRDKLLGVLLAGWADDAQPLLGRRMSILQGIANQTSLAIEADQLYQQAVQQERVQREIELARSIQESFLPECCPVIPGWQVAAEWRAARGVGGDFYDFIRPDAHHLGVVIADVSGKGVAAALYMALSRTAMRTAALGTSSPAATLRRANRILMEDERSGMYVSVFYGLVDLDSGLMTYARAGHNPPLLIRAADGSITTLNPPGIVLGVVESPEIAEETVALAPGDVLVAYTDGVTEAVDEENQEFGEERLQQVLTRATEHTAGSLIELIDAGVRVFTGEREQFDDMTLVVLKREGGGAAPDREGHKEEAPDSRLAPLEANAAYSLLRGTLLDAVVGAVVIADGGGRIVLRGVDARDRLPIERHHGHRAMEAIREARNTRAVQAPGVTHRDEAAGGRGDVGHARIREGGLHPRRRGADVLYLDAAVVVAILAVELGEEHRSGACVVSRHAPDHAIALGLLILAHYAHQGLARGDGRRPGAGRAGERGGQVDRPSSVRLDQRRIYDAERAGKVHRRRDGAHVLDGQAGVVARVVGGDLGHPQFGCALAQAVVALKLRAIPGRGIVGIVDDDSHRPRAGDDGRAVEAGAQPGVLALVKDLGRVRGENRRLVGRGNHSTGGVSVGNAHSSTLRRGVLYGDVGVAPRVVLAQVGRVHQGRRIQDATGRADTLGISLCALRHLGRIQNGRNRLVRADHRRAHKVVGETRDVGQIVGLGLVPIDGVRQRVGLSPGRGRVLRPVEDDGNVGRGRALVLHLDARNPRARGPFGRGPQAEYLHRNGHEQQGEDNAYHFHRTLTPF